MAKNFYRLLNNASLQPLLEATSDFVGANLGSDAR